MADYRNHRQFTLRCIKASITPVSCKLKTPPSFRSSKSYQIIHKAEKQLLYECIRNINGILAMLDKQRTDQYSKFKGILSNQTTNRDPISVSDTPCDQILDRARLFINRIKEHRHDKIKARQQNKFEWLFFKIHGCHHNLSRHHQVFDNINPNSNNLGNHPNVPTGSSPRPSTPSNTSTPATSTANNQPTTANPNNTNSNPNNPSQATDHMAKWVINLSRAPLTNDQLTLLQKGPNFPITPK